MEMVERHCCTDRVGMNDHTIQFDSHSFWTQILLFFTWICTLLQLIIIWHTADLNKEGWHEDERLHTCTWICLGRTDKGNSDSESQSYVPVNISEGNVIEKQKWGHEMYSVFYNFVTQLECSVIYQTLHHSHIPTSK